MNEPKKALSAPALEILQPPYRGVSREVTEDEKDIQRVKEDALGMLKLCHRSSGRYRGATAVAHCQVCTDPLRFLVTRDGYVFVNPSIVRHTRTPVESREGCLSYPNLSTKVVERWYRIELEFTTIKEDKLAERVIRKCKGAGAYVFQNAIDMMNGVYIHDDPQ